MFKEFFKTTIGMKSKCDSGSAKTAGGAYDASDPGSAGAASAIAGAFGGGKKAPEPPPPPADVSTGSLGSRITAGLNSMTGG